MFWIYYAQRPSTGVNKRFTALKFSSGYLFFFFHTLKFDVYFSIQPYDCFISGWKGFALQTLWAFFSSFFWDVGHSCVESDFFLHWSPSSTPLWPYFLQKCRFLSFFSFLFFFLAQKEKKVNMFFFSVWGACEFPVQKEAFCRVGNQVKAICVIYATSVCLQPARY